MKLDYSYIFRESGIGEDKQIAGCGFSRAYARFLLSVSSGFNSFYNDDGSRVFLNDDELQILENGQVALAGLMIKGCDRMYEVSKHTLASGHSIPVTFDDIPANNFTHDPSPLGTYDWLDFDIGTGKFILTRTGVYLFVWDVAVVDAINYVYQIQAGGEGILRAQQSELFGPNIRLTTTGLYVLESGTQTFRHRHIGGDASGHYNLSETLITRLGDVA